MACCSSVGDLATTNSYGIEPKVRYSAIDRRKNIYEIKNEEGDFYETVAMQSQSVACMINKVFFKPNNDGNFYLVNTFTLKEEMFRRESTRFGEQEKFRKEPVPGIGTAFLVGPDPAVKSCYAMTAGHCLCIKDTETLDVNRIKNYWIVFGFQKKRPMQTEFKFKASDIYKIKKNYCLSKYFRKGLWII